MLVNHLKDGVFLNIYVILKFLFLFQVSRDVGLSILRNNSSSERQQYEDDNMFSFIVNWNSF